MLIPFRILQQLSDGVHDQALSCSNQVRNGRTETGQNDIVSCSRHRLGIVRRLMQQHAPIKKDFAKGTHGIGIKYVDKRNLARDAVDKYAAASWIDEFKTSLQSYNEGTS